MKKKSARIMGIIIFVILVIGDQLTKYFAKTCLTNGRTFDIIKKVLRFNYVKNTGAAWGIMSGKQWFFIILTSVMLAAVIYVYVRTPYEKKYRPLLIILPVLAAGAVGNLVDRIRNGYVDDFIDFYLINFPVFNVADICVCISMITLVLLIIFKYKDNDFDYLKIKKQNDVRESEQHNNV